MAIKVHINILFDIYIYEGKALPSPLCIKFPQMNAYAKFFDKNNKCVNLLVNDQEMWKTNNEIWDKITNLFERKFDSEPVYNDKYIKARTCLYNTNFYGKGTPIEGKHYTCFFVKLLDSIVNVDNKYHPRIILKECKYAIKTKKIMNAINEELKLN